MSVNSKRSTDSSSDNESSKRLKLTETPEDRLKSVLKKEIQNEINIRSADLEKIETRIFETKRHIEKVRQGVVAEYFGQSYKGDLQPPPHPAVKDTFRGKYPRIKEEKLSDDDLPHFSGNVKSEEPSDVQSNLKQPRYVPPKYEEKDIVQLFEPRGNEKKQKYRLIIGNVSKWIANEDEQATHKWTVYVKCKKENGENIEVADIFSSVVFFLHPSYKPNDVIRIDYPPFKITRRGWGEFRLKVRVYFAHELDKSLDVIHQIKLDRTHSGFETFGAETMVDAWAYARRDLPIKEEINQVVKPQMPTISSIPFSSDISTDILSEIFDSPDEPKESLGAIHDIDIKTECGDVPIEDIDIKPLDYIPPIELNENVSKPLEIPEELNQVIKEEVVIESEQVSKEISPNVFVFENTEVKEEIIYPEEISEVIYENSDVKEEVIYESVNGDTVKPEVKNISPSKPIQIKLMKPQEFELIKNKLAISRNEQKLKMLKLIPPQTIKIVQSPSKKPLKQQPKVIVFDSVKSTSGSPLFKIVIDPATAMNLPKSNGIKASPPKPNMIKIEKKPKNNNNKQPVTTGKFQTNLPSVQKPILVTGASGEKQTLILQRKVLPGISLLKKAENVPEDKKPNSEHTQRPLEKVEFAVKSLVKRFPLVDKQAFNDSFRAIHPYCAPTVEVFLSWPLGKQRAAEWMRAKTIAKLIPKFCDKLKPWSTIQVLDWCRLFGFTPKEPNTSEPVTSVQEPISLNFSPPPSLKSVDEIMCCKKLEKIEVVSGDDKKEKSKSENKTLLFLPLQKEKGLGDFIQSSSAHYVSKSFAKEEIIEDVSYPAAVAVLVSAFNSVAEDLIRRSHAASLTRNNEAPDEIIENDVKNALFSRAEFDLFTNEGLGKEEDQD